MNAKNIIIFSSCIILASCGLKHQHVYKEAIFAGLCVVDAYQTAKWQGEELNPIIGDQPSDGKVAGYFVSAVVTHAIITIALPETWRDAWLDGSIAIEGGVVIRNAGR